MMSGTRRNTMALCVGGGVTHHIQGDVAAVHKSSGFSRWLGIAHSAPWQPIPLRQRDATGSLSGLTDCKEPLTPWRDIAEASPRTAR